MKNLKTTTAQSKIRTTGDLARHVGLSRATVSRILNGHPGISQKNIDRVMQVVERTGFSPNPYSNILRGKRSATIAVCLSSFKRHSVIQKLAAVVHRLAGLGYTTLIESAENNDHVTIMKWIMRMRAEAVVFVGHHDHGGLAAHVRDLARARIPHVFTEDFGDDNANIVTVDRAQGLELIANHLLDLGHRTIGLIGIGGEMPFQVARLTGLHHALRARQMNPDEVLVSLANPPPRGGNMLFGREAAQRFVSGPKMPTAFVALDDEVAFGAIQGFRAAGLSVPGDVSVAGFNHEELAKVASPSITTVDAEIEATATAAVNFLIGQLLKRGMKSARSQLLPTRLIVGESTGPAAR